MLCVLILIGALAGGRTDILSCHRLRTQQLPGLPTFRVLKDRDIAGPHVASARRSRAA